MHTLAQALKKAKGFEVLKIQRRMAQAKDSATPKQGGWPGLLDLSEFAKSGCF